MIQSIEKGMENGKIKDGLNARGIAIFILSGYWGIRNFGKLENNKSIYIIYLQQLKAYFKTLE